MLSGKDDRANSVFTKGPPVRLTVVVRLLTRGKHFPALTIEPDLQAIEDCVALVPEGCNGLNSLSDGF